MSLQRMRVPLLGLLVLLGFTLVGCQQQPGAMQSATEGVEISTPTVAPSPTAEDFISDVGSLPCGPLGFSINIGEGKIFLAWTPDGANLVFNYYAGGEVDSYERDIFTGIWLVDAAGSQLAMLVDANPSRESQYGHHAAVSPDGTQLVYASCEFPFPNLRQPARRDFNFEVAVIGIDGTGQRRLTRNTRLDTYPAWSPDGSRLAFLVMPLYSSAIMLYTMAADGSEAQQVIPPHRSGLTRPPPVWWPDGERVPFYGLTLAPPVWSPDGERLAFQVNTDYFYDSSRDLYLARADGSEITLLAEDVVSVPTWSPDGQRLAVAKIVGEDVGLYTLAADGSDLQFITSIFELDWLNWYPSYNGSVPILAWSPDGTQILYTCLEAAACIIDLASGEVVMIESEIAFLITRHVAAWSPDGTRVAIFTPGEAGNSDYLRLYTVAPDGTDRRHLIRVDDDGNLLPANPPQDGH